MRQWIRQLNESIHVGITFTESLAKTLVNRANHVRWRVKNKGGREREKFFEANWELTLPVEEVEQSLMEENSMLLQKVDTLSAHVRTSTRLLRERNGQTNCRKRTAKHYSERHDRRIKKQRALECAAALSWMEDEGLMPVKVVALNSNTNQMESIILRADIEKALAVSEDVSDRDLDLVSMMLYIKDRYNISGQAYHEMASLCREMPRHYRLKEKIAALNSKWNIHPTPEGTVGVQQRIAERLHDCIERLVSIPMQVCII